MAQVTLDTEDALLLASYVINMEHDFEELGKEQDYVVGLVKQLRDAARSAESIEFSEALDEDLAGPEMAPKPHIVEGGIVMGSVSTGYVGSQKTFELCSLEEWEQLTAKEADQLFQECLWENIDAGY